MKKCSQMELELTVSVSSHCGTSKVIFMTDLATLSLSRRSSALIPPWEDDSPPSSLMGSAGFPAILEGK